MRRLIRVSVFALAVPLALLAQEKVDLDAIYKIKDEAFNRSKVMEHMFYLTDVHGPRLTNSPNYKNAADWVVSTLKGWGLDSARTEKWGPFGKGWRNDRFSAHLLEPSYAPIYGFPYAWTPSTEGAIVGEPVYALIRTEADMEKWKGKLKGKIVLNTAPRELQPIDRALLSRYTQEELDKLAAAPEITGGNPFGGLSGNPLAGPGRAAAAAGPGNFQQQQAFTRKLAAFWREEGVGVLVGFGYRNDGGTMAASTGTGSSRDNETPVGPPSIVITPEHYNRVARLLDRKIPVKLEIEVKNTFFSDNLESLNVVAEIPGSGPKKDEVVMIGGHLDSWHGGTGATDNAAGSAVMMEAMRILKTLNLKLNRTVRIGLWGGEEQGLLGSRAYVKEHFADRTTMKTTAEWDKLSGYYNIDNGTGKIRGIYLQGNEAARPFFEAQLAPFKDIGVSHITIRNTGGTDHQSFDGVGLPGFQFIQDAVEYSTRTHHSNMDVYDRIQRGDLMQMAAVVSSLVYHTSIRTEMLPRKPKPAPSPDGGRRGGGGGPPTGAN